MRNYLLMALALGACAVTAEAAVPGIELKRRNEASRWADSVYNTLSERQRVAQLVFPKVVPTHGENSKATLRKYIGDDDCGGLLFS